MKKRVAALGKGKRGGFRTIVAYKTRKRAYFLHGFSKNERENVDPNELAALRKLAKVFLGYSSKQLTRALEAGAIVKVQCDEQD